MYAIRCTSHALKKLEIEIKKYSLNSPFIKENVIVLNIFFSLTEGPQFSGQTNHN